MGELATKLQDKIKSYKNQIEEAEVLAYYCVLCTVGLAEVLYFVVLYTVYSRAGRGTVSYCTVRCVQ